MEGITAMTDETTTEAPETVSETSADTSTETEAATAPEPSETTELGDAGKKALDAMKAKWKAAEASAKERDAKLAELQAKIDGKEAEYAAEQKARELETAALSKANERILKAEVRAAAAAKLADPADALRFIDLSDFEVGADGEVDAQAIGDAIDNLVTTKPYLAAQGGKRFQGTADGGARNDATKVGQLSETDLSRMSPEQIESARKEGRLNDLLGIKT